VLVVSFMMAPTAEPIDLSASTLEVKIIFSAVITGATGCLPVYPEPEAGNTDSTITCEMTNQIVTITTQNLMPAGTNYENSLKWEVKLTYNLPIEMNTDTISFTVEATL
jgi:hypothetical protein